MRDLSLNEDGSIAWVDYIYLVVISKILFEENFEETWNNNGECQSDSRHLFSE